MKQSIKCLLGLHNYNIIGIPPHVKVLYKCNKCGKYGLWYRDKGVYTKWTYNINKFPEYVVEYIIKNKL